MTTNDVRNIINSKRDTALIEKIWDAEDAGTTIEVPVMRITPDDGNVDVDFDYEEIGTEAEFDVIGFDRWLDDMNKSGTIFFETEPTSSEKETLRKAIKSLYYGEEVR